MSQLQVGFAALQDAANAAQGAAADAKGHGSADALTWAAGSIPGASSVDQTTGGLFGGLLGGG